jgi:hypothetical protein
MHHPYEVRGAGEMQESLSNAFYPFAALRAGSEVQGTVPQRILGAEIWNMNSPSKNI